MPLTDPRQAEAYPTLSAYSDPVRAAERTIVGREKEIEQMMAAMRRPELSNVLLLAPAGSGKSALVQGAMLKDESRLYLEVDLARMVAGARDSDAMAGELKRLFDEAESFFRQENQQLVVFMDEIHQVVQLSPAAVEALKPVLAASGARGLRIIAATTHEEFNLHMAANLPLVERFQQIKLEPADKATTVQILRGYARRYEVERFFPDDRLFELIYDWTDRYVPASVQPRQSIRVLDAMMGWHLNSGRRLDKDLLADVLLESTGQNVVYRVDAVRIREQLDAKVYSQKLATASVARRLEICVADLQDKTRPASSFLFTGGSGVGKSTTVSTAIPVFTQDGSVAWKTAGEIVPGDMVFSREGAPEKVLGVFPQGERDVYRVTLTDGRTLDCSDNHLWAVVPAKRARDEGFTIYSTQTLMNKGLTTRGRDGREAPKYFIPAHGAVQWPQAQLSVDPYVMGAMIANGLLTQAPLELSSDDLETVERVGQKLGAAFWEKANSNYTWSFFTGEQAKNGMRARLQLHEVFGDDAVELIGVKSTQRSIPVAYKTASIEQRWELIRGLFDCDGSIGQHDGDRFNVSYSTASETLARDVREVLLSLGVGATIGTYERERDGKMSVEHRVMVKSKNGGKDRFFALERKLAIAQRAKGVARQRERSYDFVGIKSIEKLDRQEAMVCIYVDHDEHLYQAGEFVVTHNTELVKQMANLLFGDSSLNLIRFDMSEYANDDMLNTFRYELTQRVAAVGRGVILLDEIEKASGKIVRLLLQLLDDGRLTDQHGRQVSFLTCYVVMTTNAASEIYRTVAHYNPDDDGSGRELLKRMTEIKRSLASTSADNKFPPELLGRIDTIVPFQPLSRDTQSKVVKSKLAGVRRELMAKHGVRMAVDERVMDYLIEDQASTDSDAGGARGIISVMTDKVVAEVAAFVNRHENEKAIRVDIEGVLRSEDKELLESNARVVVSADR